jgi:hypothetical protein
MSLQCSPALYLLLLCHPNSRVHSDHTWKAGLSLAQVHCRHLSFPHSFVHSRPLDRYFTKSLPGTRHFAESKNTVRTPSVDTTPILHSFIHSLIALLTHWHSPLCQSLCSCRHSRKQDWCVFCFAFAQPFNSCLLIYWACNMCKPVLSTNKKGLPTREPWRCMCRCCGRVFPGIVVYHPKIYAWNLPF